MPAVPWTVDSGDITLDSTQYLWDGTFLNVWQWDATHFTLDNIYHWMDGYHVDDTDALAIRLASTISPATITSVIEPNAVVSSITADVDACRES